MGAPAARPFLCIRGRGAEPLWEPRKQGLGGPEDVAPGAWRGHHVESRGWEQGLPPLVGTNPPARLRGQKCGDSIDAIKCHATYTKHKRRVQRGDTCCGPWFSDSTASGQSPRVHQRPVPGTVSPLREAGETLGTTFCKFHVSLKVFQNKKV